MKFQARLIFVAGIFVYFATISAAPAATECQLKQLASLNIVKSSDGAPLVPVEVAGTREYFELAPSDSMTAITAPVADSLDLRRTSVPQNLMWFLGGQKVKEKVTTDLKIGNADIHTYLGISYGALSHDPRVAGILAFDVLKMIDLELDLAHDRANLFSQDHCKGNVIYWTRNAPVAVIPLDMPGVGEQTFLFKTELDGQAVATQLDPEAAHGRLNSLVAKRAFEISDDAENGGGSSPHTFKTLSADGITILNPTIDIYRSEVVCAGTTKYLSTSGVPAYSPTFNTRCFGAAPLYLGYSELRDLHMYFAFGEGMLYATAADAK